MLIDTGTVEIWPLGIAKSTEKNAERAVGCVRVWSAIRVMTAQIPGRNVKQCSKNSVEKIQSRDIATEVAATVKE